MANAGNVSRAGCRPWHSLDPLEVLPVTALLRRGGDWAFSTGCQLCGVVAVRFGRPDGGTLHQRGKLNHVLGDYASGASTDFDGV